MLVKNSVFLICALGALNVGWGQNVPNSNTPSSVSSSDAAEDNKQVLLINEAARLIAAGKAQEALNNYIDKVIDAYETKYGNSKVKIYSARTQTESLLYLLEAGIHKENAKVVSAVWSEAFFLKSYVLIELKRPQEAAQFLDRALELSPHNSQFLSELGNRYKTEKNWTKALETYQKAEESAKSFSAVESKNLELGRAWRGEAFVYVEQGRLDEAEATYLKCLELSSSDSSATRELNYVRGLKAKKAALKDAIPYTHIPTGVVVPTEIQGYQIGQINNLEASQPGQGVKINYTNPGKFDADITVFNAGIVPLPISANDPKIQILRDQEVESILKSARSVSGLGATLSRKTMRKDATWPNPNEKVDLLYDAFIVYPQGSATNDNLFIWISKGFIWKLHVTRNVENRTDVSPVSLLKSMIDLSTVRRVAE
jgi:Flp pilus assembly protein TadD